VAKPGREHDVRLSSVPCTAEEFARHDAVVISTAHSDFKTAALYARTRLVIDTRNVMAPLGYGAQDAAGPQVVRA
jgi:UDP-N-acetyl-D-mannosaminuronate dehydrogenase